MEAIEDDKDILIASDSKGDQEEVTLQYMWALVDQAGNVPLDVARSILASYRLATAKTGCSG